MYEENENGGLKKRLKRKIIKLLLIVILAIVIVCGLIAALYETPIAIFLPRLDKGENIADSFRELNETGMEQIGEKLAPYYVSFNEEIYRKDEDEDLEVRYNQEQSNFWDVVRVYASIAGTTDFSGKAGMSSTGKTVNPCIVDSNTEPILEDVFDKMVTYTTSYETVIDVENGDSMGEYSIGSRVTGKVYDKKANRECIVNMAYKKKFPLGCTIKVGSKNYKVTAHEKLSDGTGIVLCLNEDEEIKSVGKVKKVTFVGTKEFPNITHEKRIVTVDYMSASRYVATYGMSEEAEFYFDEIGKIDDTVFSNETQRAVGVISTPLNLSDQEFIDMVGSAAVAYYPEYQILPSFVIAQAILESAWGRSGLAVDCHNYFGMKWTSGCGCDYKEYGTGEQRSDGSYYKTNAKFRKYATFDEGMRGYYEFMQYPRYQNLRGVTGYETVCDLIRKDGWATSLSYTQDLIRVIRSYNLTIYDEQVL